MPLDSKRKGRIVAGVTGLAVAIGYVAMSARLPSGTLAEPGGGAFPLAVGSAFAVVSFLTVVEAARGDTVSGSVALPRGVDHRRLLLLVASVLGYAVLLPFLGQLLASFCFVAASLRILSQLSMPRAAIYGAIVAGLCYGLFIVLLRVPMPTGVFGL